MTSRAPASDAWVGRTLAQRFVLKELLGGGPFSRVYAAQETKIERECAVKILLAPFGGDDDLRRRFLAEARAYARTAHPNLVTVLDFGATEDDVMYIAMERVWGRTLREHLAADGPFSAGRAIGVGLQLCRALRVVHLAGLVHRDVKPSNVMLVDDGGDELVKLLDFGVVKDLLREDTLTEQGMAIGTPRYMAPEIATGSVTDARADVYSLGVVLYELLSGRPPFDASTASALLYAHVHVAPPPLESVMTDPPPPRLAQAVMTCLEKDPRRRFGHVGQLRAALEEALAEVAGPTTLGSPPTADDVATPASIASLPRGASPVPRDAHSVKVIELPRDVSTIPVVKKVRGSLLASSIVTLRKRGLFDRYARNIDPDLLSKIVFVGVSEWVDLSLALAHYAACDALDLPAEEQVENGRWVARAVQSGFVSVVLRLAKETGLTPWSVLDRGQRLLGRVFDGGAPGLTRLGPKEALVEFVQAPFFRYPYMRNGFVGTLCGVTEIVSRRAYGTLVPALTNDTRIGVRLSWA